MPISLAAASPLEVAALWRLDLLSGNDLSAICMRWLEQDTDRGDQDIATLAGEVGVTLAEAGSRFERILELLIGRVIQRDEAILIALRLHLAVALAGDDLLEGVSLTLGRFAHLSETRRVRNPRRARDHPDGVYAAEELGLEYIYGGFHAFDDIQHFSPDDRKSAEATLRNQLRLDVRELHDHIASITDAQTRL